MIYRVRHTTTYHYSETVPICHNEVLLTPRDCQRQTTTFHRLLIRPRPKASGRRIDYFGNPVSYFTVEDGHQKLIVTAKSRVRVAAAAAVDPAASPPWETVRDTLLADRSVAGLDALQFRFDSPCIRGSQEFLEYAAPSFTPGRPILEAALDLTRRIHAEFKYDPTATTVNTTINEVLKKRRGVCQDFAHLQIGCLRSIGLAARYISGYLLTAPPPGQPRLVGTDASHAWLSVYTGPFGWVDMDPTNNKIPSDEHITLAWGRDYSDVCPIKGVFHGGGQHTVSVSVDVAPFVATPGI